MAAKKAKTVFVCQECGFESAQWMGKCICGAWNSFVEEKILPESSGGAAGIGMAGAGAGGAGGDVRRRTSATAKPAKLNRVGAANYERVDTGIGELNRVLGGGLVQGSLVLISGEPGIGKSTLIIQTAANIASKAGTVLYVSGEESEEQIKMRADRVCMVNNPQTGQMEAGIPEDLYILAETNMENVEVACENLKPKFLIIDSVQTMYSAAIDSAPGSVSQVRMCANQLMRIGKTWNIPIFIVAHVTKSGELAGPKTMEHMVDCVLNFTGERDHEFRILRAYKNRFGTTSEIGAFQMEAGGLKELSDLSGTFLENRDETLEGSVATAVYEGSRPVMFEIQALVSAANVGFARRTSVGIDNTRLNMILAVLEKKAGLQLLNQDVYINVAGGMRPEGTSPDLAVALAIYSSYNSVAAKKKTLAIGEIGLTGELRSVQNTEKIWKEAERMGYEQVIMPLRNAEKLKEAAAAKGGVSNGGASKGASSAYAEAMERCRPVGVKNLADAIAAYRGKF